MQYLPQFVNIDIETEVHGKESKGQCGEVQGGGGGGVQEDGQPVPDDDDGCRASLGPGGGHGLLVVTGKRRGRPRKGIVPDGLVQLRIQNFVTKYQN